MERSALLAMLVLSIRTNVRSIQQVLEELNAGRREQTYPRALERYFRAMEHDARTLRLDRLADLLETAKETSANVLKTDRMQELVEVFNDVVGELTRTAEDIEQGRKHQLDPALRKRLLGFAA